MSSPRSIRNLAAQAGITPEEALALLQAAGLPQKLVSQSVARSDLPKAWAILDLGTLSPPTPSEVPAAVTSLPATAAISVSSLVETKPESFPIPKVSYDLPTIGTRSRDIQYLDIDLVARIHQALEREFADSGDPISPSGPRGEGELLSSAVFRPQTSAAGHLKYPTMEMAGAALVHSLVHNHPFYDGNKRAAAVALVIFLDRNGYIVLCEEGELVDVILSLTRHEIIGDKIPSELSRNDAEVIAVAKWINSRRKRLENYRKHMKWRELKTLLFSYGCTIENRRGNKIKVSRGDLFCHVGARNLGDEIDRKSITYIRKRLNLDDAHGFDSDIFHAGKKPISDFIMKYRHTLERLAEYDRLHG